MYLAADKGDHFSQVFRAFFKIHIIRIDHEKRPFAVILYPFIVLLVKPFEVIEAHASLITSSTVMDMLDQCRYACLDID